MPVSLLQLSLIRILDSPPKTQTETAITIIAIIAPLERVIDPESGPAAPAFESPELLPADDPTSPAEGPGYLALAYPE